MSRKPLEFTGHVKTAQVKVTFEGAPSHSARPWQGENALTAGRTRYEVADFAPSGSVDLDHPLLQAFVSGGGLEVRPKQAWTDVARFAGRGVAAANFGPDLPAQAHQQNEYAELPLLLESHERLLAFLVRNGS